MKKLNALMPTLGLSESSLTRHAAIFSRNVVITFLLSLTITIGLTAQEIKSTKVAFTLSKEALKAQKKGKLSFAGAYWNQERTALHNFYVFTNKQGQTFFEEFTVDESGKANAPKTALYTSENLAGYNLETEPAIAGDDGVGNLSGKRFSFIRRPTMAGKPKIMSGAFEDKYFNGLWNGYKFDKGAKTEMDEKFWPAYAYAYQGGIDNKDYTTRKRSAVLRVLTQDRMYIPADGQVVIGGVMASTEPKFLSGRYNLATNQWTNKVETTISPKSIAYNYLSTPEGPMVVVHSAKAKYVLSFDMEGNLRHRTDLSMTGNRYALKPEKIVIKTDGTDYFVIAPKFGKPNVGKDPGFVISKIKDGKEVFAKDFSIQTVMASMVAAPKSKEKLKNSTHLQVEGIEKLSSGDYLVILSNGNNPVTNYFAQLSPQGDLKATYQVDGIPGDGTPTVRAAGKGASHLNTEIIESNGSIYALIRSIPMEFAQGAHEDNFENDYVKITTTVRIDEVLAKCRVVKINPGKKSISKVLDLEGLAVGTIPYSLSASGKLLINARGKKGGYYKLLLD